MQSLLKKPSCLLLLSSLLVSSNSQAVDKALLIGVSEYQSNQINNLPGILLDLDMMYSTAQRLGFSQQNIQRLDKKQATYANIKQKITHWLTQNVNANDRILIYFSGHGSHIPDKNGDEIDHADEVLVPYDAQIKHVMGESYQTLEKVIIDDDLNQWLAQIPSHHIYMFVDACNSGTAFKGLNNQSLNLSQTPQVKYLSYPKMMTRLTLRNNRTGTDFADKQHPLSRVVFLAATKDDEFALATQKGSLFTLGLEQSIRTALVNKQSLTPKQLQNKVTKFIENKVISGEAKGAVYHPQLMATAKLKQKSIFPQQTIQNSVNVSQKVALQTLDKLFYKGRKLTMTAVNSTLKLDDTLLLDLNLIPNKWYLNIVYVGTDGEQKVLFPNAEEPNNQMSAGKMRFPTQQMSFDISATLPTGNSYIYAFLTRQRLNFYESSIDGFGANGEMANLLSGLSARSTRNLAVTAKKSRYYAGKLIVKVQ